MNVITKIRERLATGSKASSDIIKISTLIGKKTSVEGSLKVHGNVKIDGKVTGPIDASGDVVVGKSASIKGDISAANVIIAGKIEGNIFAKGQLSIKSTAYVMGEHTAFSLIVDEGSVFKGNCSILDKKSENSDKPTDKPTDKPIE